MVSLIFFFFRPCQNVRKPVEQRAEERQEVRLQCSRDRAPLTSRAPRMGLDMMLKAGSSYPRVKAREEQDPIWDLGRASCLPAVGRKRRSRAWE